MTPSERYAGRFRTSSTPSSLPERWLMPTKKILIVEDDPDVREGMHVRLKANHYDTFVAAGALTALAEARKHQPDLIILDLGLPAGDGFVVMERLNRVPALALIPVIVVSA